MDFLRAGGFSRKSDMGRGNMRILHYWRYPGCGAHATVYLKDGLVAVPAKYGNRLTLWDVSDIKHPRLVADLPDRPDCQAAALCNGYLIVGSNRGIESMRFSRTELVPVGCSSFAPEINDFEVAGDTVLAISKRNAIKVVCVGDNGRLTDIGVRENVLARCHGASHEGNLVGVIGFKGDGKVETPLGLFPDGVDDGHFTDPAGWTLANGGDPAKWYMNISNRIVLHRQRAYVATGAIQIATGKKNWLLDPSITVLNVENPANPVLLGNYPCTGSTTCTGLYLDRERECLIVGSGTIVRRFDIDGDLLHETDRLAFPYGDLGGEGYVEKPPTVHDVCKTDLVHNGLPVFVAGGQQHDDLYLFTV